MQLSNLRSAASHKVWLNKTIKESLLVSSVSVSDDSNKIILHKDSSVSNLIMSVCFSSHSVAHINFTYIHKTEALTHKTLMTAFKFIDLVFPSMFSPLDCCVEILVTDAMEEKYVEHHELLDTVT